MTQRMRKIDDKMLYYCKIFKYINNSSALVNYNFAYIISVLYVPIMPNLT